LNTQGYTVPDRKEGGTRYGVRGARYGVRGARYAVRGARYAVRGARYAVRGDLLFRTSFILDTSN
jgi:hypothetical protein